MKIKVRKKRRLTAAGFCAPCEAERISAQVAAITRAQSNPSGHMLAAKPLIPGQEPAEDDDVVDDADEEDPEAPAEPERAEEDGTIARWSGILATEGEVTGDGRMVEPGAWTWGDLPIPLRWDEEDDGAHAGAVVVGLIETVERRGADIFATGFVDLVSDNGWKAATLMDRKMLRGVSIDPDAVDFEIRIAGEVYDEMMNAGYINLETGEEVDEDGNPVEPEEPERDSDGRVVVYESTSTDELMVYTAGRIRAATLVDTPAFINAVLTLDGPLGARPPASDEAVLVPLVAGGAVDMHVVVAAAPPARPPKAWFENPNLTGPTPLTVTEDGRVFGHLALWDSCHLGYSQCVNPPRSATGYALFRTGVVLTAEGVEVPVGPLTIDTGHAGRSASLNAAVAHYDNTGRAVCDLAAGEDEWGPWLAGALRPGVTEAQKRALRASAPSGDWRAHGGQLELCAILGVNMPGFPVPRGMVASGRAVSLQLAGPRPVAAQAPGDAPLTAAERAVLRTLIADGRRVQTARRSEADEHARSMEARRLAREMAQAR